MKAGDKVNYYITRIIQKGAEPGWQGVCPGRKMHKKRILLFHSKLVYGSFSPRRALSL